MDETDKRIEINDLVKEIAAANRRVASLSKLSSEVNDARWKNILRLGDLIAEYEYDLHSGDTIGFMGTGKKVQNKLVIDYFIGRVHETDSGYMYSVTASCHRILKNGKLGKMKEYLDLSGKFERWKKM